MAQKCLVMGSLFYVSCCTNPERPFKWSHPRPFVNQFQMARLDKAQPARVQTLKLEPKSAAINERE